jgi:hypothetical protein
MTKEEQDIVRAAVDALTMALLLATKHVEAGRELERTIGHAAAALRALRATPAPSAWRLSVEGDVLGIEIIRK